MAIDEEAVTFHEIGAVDSLVDIVAAALLIARLSATRWSAGPLPLGGGRVKTAHGLLPVPAPATALLMRGLPTIDDGIEGERVTPTGAAVARYLLDARLASRCAANDPSGRNRLRRKDVPGGQQLSQGPFVRRGLDLLACDILHPS